MEFDHLMKVLFGPAQRKLFRKQRRMAMKVSGSDSESQDGPAERDGGQLF